MLWGNFALVNQSGGGLGVKLGGLRILGGHRGGEGSVCRAGAPWGAVGWAEIAWGP